MTIAVYLGHNTTTTHHSIHVLDNFEMANIGASLYSQPCQNHVLTNQLETLLKSYGHIGDIDMTYRSLMCLSIGTPKNNKFSICPKWKIHYFQVSQNLGRVQPHYNLFEYWDT